MQKTKTLIALKNVKLYAATYVDGASKAETRLIIEINGRYNFLHPTGTDSKLKAVAGWLVEQIKAEASAQTEDQEEVDISVRMGG
jgi:hypothetical protein